MKNRKNKSNNVAIRTNTEVTEVRLNAGRTVLRVGCKKERHRFKTRPTANVNVYNADNKITIEKE